MIIGEIFPQICILVRIPVAIIYIFDIDDRHQVGFGSNQIINSIYNFAIFIKILDKRYFYR